MKIEKLGKNHRKEVIGGLILISVIGILAVNLTKAKYQGIEDIKLVEGNINYKPYDFKMMAMYKSDDGTNYTEINKMPESGYVINEEKSYCTINNVDKDGSAKLYTNNGEHIIKNLQKNEKCYLYFDNAYRVTSINDLANNLAKVSHLEPPTFSNAAKTDEGVYRVSDGMYGGYSYYWRGAATTNYVKFAGKCWRIVRINGDKTMRLIYDGATCHANGTSTTDSIAVASTAYNSSYNKSEYVGWKYTSGSQRPSSITSGTNAPIKTALENWYNSNIGNNTTYASKIAEGKYCNDRNVQSGSTWASAPSSKFYYAGYNRIYTDCAPSLSCAALDTYSLKVGLITADEVMYAGGKNAYNEQYYLYNGQDYWTMSPCNWGSLGDAWLFYVTSDGAITNTRVNWAGADVRPVINLKADTLFASGGTGTQSNPYIVK